MIAYLDLGSGVLDEADVRASAFVTSQSAPKSPTLFVDSRQKNPHYKGVFVESQILRLSTTEVSDQTVYRFSSDLLRIPFASFSYWLSNDAIFSVFEQHTIGDLGFAVGGGLQCNDVFRYVRLYPEIPEPGKKANLWCPFYNGGPFTGYWLQNYQYVLWDENGKDIKGKIIYELGDHPTRYVANEGMYFRRGIAGGKRGEFFDVHTLGWNDFQ